MEEHKRNASLEPNAAYSKTNTYYLGFVGEITESNQLDEIDELKWVKIGEVQNTLIRQSAIYIVKKLAELLK